MGIFSLLGGVAKDFAEGYIEERGIQGTIEDVSELASNFTKGFKEGVAESDSEEAANRWAALVEKLKASIDGHNYQKALSQLGNYYRQYENNEKDFWYYNYRAYIYVSWLNELPHDDTQLNDMCGTIKSSIKYAYKLAENQEQIDDITDTENAFNDIVERINIMQVCFKLWGKTVDKIDSYLEVGNYKQAENTLEDHYAYYEDGLDFRYYRKMLEIKVAMLNSNEAVNKAKLETQIDKLVSIARGCTDDNDNLKALDNLIEEYTLVKAKRNAVTNIVTPLQEHVCSSVTYSDSELEYIEEYKMCIADDGTITDKERRLLLRLSKSLGISEDRTKQLENECQSPKYTKEEQEYLEEFKECFDTDGFVSDRERRLLNKIRVSLNITEDRALEIEKIVVSQRC